jgi:hypothetical protein
MEQRRLRLGDILDDYCPRERRVTNHAVVAMIEDDVKQTRCTTCDAEHAYKGGKAPRRRKKDSTGALYKEVLAGITDSDSPPVLTTPPPADLAEPVSDPDEYAHETAEATQAADAIDENEVETEHQVEDAPPVAAASEDREPQVEDGPVHRQLIRATLPRPEGQKDARPLPEFTIRSRGNGNFRGDNRGGGRPRGQGGSNGHRPQGGQRFAGSRSGNRGPGNRGQGGFRPAQPQRHGGKKRSR